MKIAATLVALVLTTQSAFAWHHHVVKIIADPKPVVHPHHSHQKFLCWYPGGWVVCGVGAAIVVDELWRIWAGPACATNQMTRQSYFGMVKDEPKLWRPLCVNRNVVSVRG